MAVEDANEADITYRRTLSLAEGFVQGPYIEQEYITGVSKESTAWDVYNNEAGKADRELVKDWSASLNFLLVFAAIFSAVLSAFIIETTKLLVQDSSELIADIMIIYANNMANGTHNIYNRPEFQPSWSAVSINCLLFGSLSASLVAALASVVALQWVADFDAAITRGGSSPRDRARRRQFRFGGVKAWKMGEIIASLPLVLYFSVILFFAGVIQWTLLLNATVGYVVIAGSVAAIIFYFTQTILAVVFVSSPFKSPLSRWIYSASHLPLITLYWVLARTGLKSAYQWMEKHRTGYHSAHLRESIALDSHTELSYNALHWLARQLSISEDSRGRLLLLVNEMLEWPSEKLESPQFRDAPWISILRFLSQKHRSALHVPHQTPEEEQEFALLANCVALPAINSTVAPIYKEHNYWFNRRDSRYWSQYCVTKDGSPAPFFHYSASLPRPDPLFLLLRDLPLPSFHSKDEMETTLRLAKWRNSDEKPLEIWQDVFHHSKSYSDEFFSACVYLLYRQSLGSALPSSRPDDLHMNIITAITRRAATSSISSSALTMLIGAFDLLVDPFIFGMFPEANGTITRPLSYGSNLRRSDREFWAIHRTMTLLLARDLHGRSGPEVTQRFSRVLGMVWLSPSNRREHDWNSYSDTFGFDCTLDDLHHEVIQDWILYMDDTDESHEIACLLLQASITHHEIGLRWLYTCAQVDVEHAFLLLKLFDALLCEERQHVSHIKVLKVLCKMLKRQEFSTNTWRVSSQGSSAMVRTFKTPYVRTIAYHALGIDDVQEEIPLYPVNRSELMFEVAEYMFWNMSLDDPPSHWEVRARLLGDSSCQRSFGITTRIVEEAFYNVEQLPKLELMFRYPTISGHYSGPTHLLFYLHIVAKGSVFYYPDTSLLDRVQSERVRLRPIIALLALSTRDEVFQLELSAGLEEHCMVQLWDHYARIKDQPSHMLWFLDQLARYHAEIYWDYEPESLAIILTAVEKTLRLNADDGLVSSLPPLINSLRQLSGSMKTHFSHRKQHPVLVAYAERVRNNALTQLSTMTVSGERNVRSLSCARALNGSAAAAWLPMCL